MIKVETEKGNVKVKLNGSIPEICSDFGIIALSVIRPIIEDDFEHKEQIVSMFKDSFEKSIEFLNDESDENDSIEDESNEDNLKALVNDLSEIISILNEKIND